MYLIVLRTAIGAADANGPVTNGSAARAKLRDIRLRPGARSCWMPSLLAPSPAAMLELGDPSAWVRRVDDAGAVKRGRLTQGGDARATWSVELARRGAAPADCRSCAPVDPIASRSRSCSP